jgi:hypothetical protein
MKLTVIVLAALGYLGTLAVHVAALCGQVWGGMPLLLAYFFGALVVFVPTAIAVREQGQIAARPKWGALLANCPVAVRVLFYATFVYGAVNFFTTAGSQKVPRGTSGRIVTLDVARGFSGHAMIFYVASGAIMLSLYRRERGGGVKGERRLTQR